MGVGLNDSHSKNDTTTGSLDETGYYVLDNKVIALLCCLAILGLLIVIANSTVLLLFGRKSSLRTKTNCFLVSLAVSDLLAGLVSVPLIILCTFPETGSILVCIGMDLTQRFLAISTILHLLGATLERYIKIVTPFRYFTLMTARRVSVALSLVWTTSLFSSLIQLSWIDPSHPEKSLSNDAIYSSVCLVVFVLVPFVCIVFAYGRIFYVIRSERKGHLLQESQQSRREALKKRNEKRVVFIYLAMTLTFLLGWLSYFLASLDRDLEKFIFSQAEWITDLLMFFRFTTSLVNPLLYTFFKADFQTALGFSKRGRHSATTLSISGTKAYSLTTLASVNVGATSAQRLSIAARSTERIRRSSSEPNRPEAQVDDKTDECKALVCDESVYRRSWSEPNRPEAQVDDKVDDECKALVCDESACRRSWSEPNRPEAQVDDKVDDECKALVCDEST